VWVVSCVSEGRRFGMLMFSLRDYIVYQTNA
jgi:hypothetical protein